MKINKNFKLLEKKAYKKYKIEYNEFKHKSGARIIWIKNKDKDRFFAIEFATFPQDKSGTPHILEHTLLHGSKKYPIFGNDPYAVLVRRRQLSVVNAYTYPDKTAYIFSAINNEDFLNTLDLYLDAVFNPSVLHEENIFRQEGWRIEKANGKYVYNGVVLNEMLASYGSYDRRLFEGIYSFVLRENPIYTNSSGGDPNYIVDLKYKKFIEFYKTFYNAKNAIVYLYGDVSPKAFDKIDEYLSAARKGKFFKQSVKFPKEQKTKTEYIKGDPRKDSAFAVAFPGFYAKDVKSNLALEIILRSLSTFSSDALRQVFEKSDLVQDFGFDYETYAPLHFVVAYFKHIDSSNFKKLDDLLFKAIKELAKEGLDKQRIKSQLDKAEFILEKMVHDTSLGEVIFDELSKFWRQGKAYHLFELPRYIKELKEELEKNPEYFDKLFKKVFLNNKHIQKFKLKAKADYEEYSRLQAKQEKLNQLSEKAKAKIEKQIKEFQEFKQHKDDLSIISPSNLSKTSKTNLLKNSLEKLNLSEKDGTKIIFNKLSSKVTKNQILFNLSHLSLEELQRASVLVSSLDRFASKRLKRDEIDSELSKFLPRFSKEILAKNVDKNQVFLHINLEYLQKHEAKAKDLLEIYINDLKLSEDILKDQLLKLQSNLKSAIKNWSQAYPMVARLANASISKEASLIDSIQGFDFLNFINKEIENFDLDAYLALYAKLFAGGIDYILRSSKVENSDFNPHILSSRSGEAKLKNDVKLRSLDDEIFLTDGLGANINSLAFNYNPQDYFLLKYVAMLLNFNYLWENIRVKGGAYGAYIMLDFKSSASFTSFNDPNIEKSYEYFLRSLSEALDNISAEDLEGAKARTLLYFDQPKSSWSLPTYFLDLLLDGVELGELDKQKNRILSLSKEDLKEFMQNILKNIEKKSKKLTLSDKALLKELPGGFRVKELDI